MKSIGYRLRNTQTDQFSKGRVISRWWYHSKGRNPYEVDTSSTAWKTFTSVEQIKKHLLNMLMKDISTDHWVVEEILSQENAILKDLCDEKMLMKVLKTK